MCVVRSNVSMQLPLSVFLLKPSNNADMFMVRLLQGMLVWASPRIHRPGKIPTAIASLNDGGDLKR